MEQLVKKVHKYESRILERKKQMSKDYRTTADVVKEKYEDRGWNQSSDVSTRNTPIEPIKPLPLTEEEYRKFSMLWAKLALQDRDSKKCEIYFDLQRRAYYGNGYSSLKEMKKIEQEMWSLGTGEIIEDAERNLR